MKGLLLVSTALLTVRTPLSAQDSRTLEALLAEVRQLRMTLERASLVPARMQLAIQRLTIGDQRMARISSQLESVRKEISRQREDAHKAGIMAAELERSLAGTTEPQRRKANEESIATLKRIAAGTVDGTLLQRESELASLLQQERVAWEEINTKLRQLERLLEPQVSGK